jgi:hypothetical protein
MTDASVQPAPQPVEQLPIPLDLIGNNFVPHLEGSCGRLVDGLITMSAPLPTAIWAGDAAKLGTPFYFRLSLLFDEGPYSTSLDAYSTTDELALICSPSATCMPPGRQAAMHGSCQWFSTIFREDYF